MATVAVVLLVGPVASTSEPPAAVTYRTVGRLGIQADVFRPDGPGPFPVVLWIHGGALIFGDRGMLPAVERERYLRAGLAVASIDGRPDPGYLRDPALSPEEAAHAVGQEPSLGRRLSRPRGSRTSSSPSRVSATCSTSRGRGVGDPVVARAFDRAVAFLNGRLGAARAHPRLLLDPSRVDELRSRGRRAGTADSRSAS